MADHATYPNSSFLATARGRAQIDDLRADILPPEVLSHIFTFGEQAERFTRTKQSSQNARFQELVSVSLLKIHSSQVQLSDLWRRHQQVCSRWRAVAINNPALWTWITIKRPSHCEMTASYLVRAGSTTRLDIEIEMRSGFWDRAEILPTDWASQLQYTSNLIEFLKAHGASPGRWRTLSIWARQPEPLFEVLSFLHGNEAPVLQCLSLKWASKSMQRADESRALDRTRMSLRSLVLSGPSVPNLRCVELTSVPWPFVLNRPTPLFTGLTSLSLAAATQLDSITKLINLLRSNPLLQSLHLSSGPDNMDIAYFSDYPLPSVCLPSLHSLSVHSAYYSDWILDVLKAVRVPNLTKFTLATELYTDYPGEATGPELMLLNYLSGGSGDAYIDRCTSSSEIKSIYPSLRELDVSSVGCYHGGKTIMTLLSSFPTVTRLSVASHQIDCLARFPWVLPKLDSLSLNGHPHPDLGKVLQRRAAAGHPIRMVELRGDHSWDPEERDAYINALPVEVTVIEHSEPESAADDGESTVEYWEDEVDDEEEGEYFDTGDEWTEGAEVSLNDDGLEDEQYEEYDEEEEYDGGVEYELSDGFNETEEYPGDVYLPACWIEEDGGASQVYDSEDLYDGGWAYSDSNPFIGESYHDEAQTPDEGCSEDVEWGGYNVDDSGGDGEDLEDGGSDYGGCDDGYEDYGDDIY